MFNFQYFGQKTVIKNQRKFETVPKLQFLRVFFDILLKIGNNEILAGICNNF